MDQTTGLLSGLCGLGIVCSGLLLVGFFVLIRLTGRGLLPLLASVLNRRSDEPEIEIPRLRRRRVDLRAQAESVDFDAAMAAASQTPNAPPPPRRPHESRIAQAAPSEPWAIENGRRPTNEDEIFGGLLDIDGDGDPDL